MTSRADASSMWPVRKTWRWRSESAAGSSASVFGAELDGFFSQHAYVPAEQETVAAAARAAARASVARSTGM